MIKTSIIVSVYNTEEYLQDCFDSIYRQTQKEIEIIAINDGSTDNSLCILEEIRRAHPGLIIYSQENQGLGAARNRGLELATGAYIYFLDSDDCLMEHAMETCYQYAEGNQLDMLMFDAETFGEVEHKKGSYDRREKIDKQRQVLDGETFAKKYWRTTYCPSACLVYTSARFLRENQLKFLPGIYYEDNEFHCKSLPLARRVMYIPEVLYRRRCREGSITASDFDMRHARDFLFMIQAVDRLQNDENMHCILCEKKLDFLNTLCEQSCKGHLLQDCLLAGDFWETAVHICGGDIERINNFYVIETLCHISGKLSLEVVPKEIRIRMNRKKREMLRKLFAEIPLREENACVGIYGIGRHTERFLDEYQANVGEIRAEIVPIESSIRTRDKKYRKWNVVSIDEIGRLPLACIVVASSRFEQEMYQTVKEKYGECFPVIRLWTDLHF